jgi:hypothetical protein
MAIQACHSACEPINERRSKPNVDEIDVHRLSRPSQMTSPMDRVRVSPSMLIEPVMHPVNLATKPLPRNAYADPYGKSLLSMLHRQPRGVGRAASHDIYRVLLLFSD